MRFWMRFRGALGIVVLVLVMTVALLRVFTLQFRQVDTDRKVIRMVHWQLETGVHEALQRVADEYSKIHPEVEIQQILIGERSYAAWVTTRLIGNTAPDLIGIGTLPESLMNQLYLRYFISISQEILQPNPYNRGTDLEGMSWKDTYYDNMEGGFVTDLLEYYSVPSSAFTIRIFYNKRLFKEATGLDAPPGDFREFFRACEKIREYGQRKGRPLVPIAGAGKYNTALMFDRFETTVTSTLLDEADFNRDGEVSSEESAIALVGGRVSFRDPRIRAMFKGREAYIPQFQPAFPQADRMDAAFLFIQQKALMIASGSWDAASYAKQADFEIGICDFPLPSRSDPEFGRFIQGPAAEDLSGGFSFAVCRQGGHSELALDFLKFLSSKRMNNMLNREIKWIPMIRGNLPDPFIAPFWPHLKGVKRGINFSIGPLNSMANEELMNLHSCGKITFDGYLERFLPKFVDNTDIFMNLDRPRDLQLSDNQDEFRRTLEQAVTRLDGHKSDKAVAILEGQLARHFTGIEFSQLYQQAREETKLEHKDTAK